MLEWLSAPFAIYLPQNLAALAVAMVWGQKSALSPDQYQMFSSTGLLHLLVLSGQNITLLVGFLGVLTQRLGVKVQLFLTIGVALFYLAVFGSEPPIVRASVMAILSALAIFFQSTALPLFLLGLTASGMLICQPEWLGSLSFQLSLAATLGILLLYPYFQSRLKFKNSLSQAFFLSLSAQIFTTPLLLVNFRQFSLLTLPVNVVAGLLVEPIMGLGVLLSFVGNSLPLLGPLVALGLFGFLSLLELLVKLVFPLSLIFTVRI